MKQRMLLLTIFGLLVTLVMTHSDRLLAKTDRAVVCQQSMTIFKDVSMFGRKIHAANNINKTHAEYARDGWRFVDMEAYTENGDLEGFFLTYSRATACH